MHEHLRTGARWVWHKLTHDVAFLIGILALYGPSIVQWFDGADFSFLPAVVVGKLLIAARVLRVVVGLAAAIRGVLPC